MSTKQDIRFLEWTHPSGKNKKEGFVLQKQEAKIIIEFNTKTGQMWGKLGSKSTQMETAHVREAF